MKVKSVNSSVLFSILALLVSLPVMAGSKQIHVSNESWVPEGKIYFSQIVQAGNVSEAEETLFKKIVMGDAPSFGEARKFSNQAISEALRGHINKGILKSVMFVIPKEVTVYGAGELITKEKITSRIQSELVQGCSECRFEISELKLPANRNFPLNTKWNIKMDSTRAKGPFSIPLEVKEPGQPQKIFWISGRISAFREIPIATRALNTGQRVSKDDFKIMSKDVSFATDVPPTIEEMIGAELKSGVPMGQPIWRGSLAREKAMSFGEQITIVSGSDSWKVTLRGISRQNAFVGDDVQVMNPDTKKLIIGKVIGKGLVEVK